jgi:hypothetical protein
VDHGALPDTIAAILVSAATTQRRRRVLHLLGTAVSLLALVYVLRRVVEHRDVLLAPTNPGALTLAVVLGGAVYAVASLALSAAWQRLIVLHGDAPFPFRDAHRINARANLAKYLPGNVLHLAGRHGMGRALGLAHATLFGAMAHESASLILVGGALALLGWTLTGPDRRGPDVETIAMLTLAAVLVPTAFLYVRNRVRRTLDRGGTATRPGERWWIRLLMIHQFHLVFFLTAGTLLVGLSWTVVGRIDGLVQAGSILLAFAVAWIAGYVTPGAPSGLGVREAVLVTLLGQTMAPEQALLVAVAFRLLTILGDLLFFATSFSLSTERRAPVSS